MGEKRVFTEDFKERAVELAWTTDRKQSEIAGGGDQLFVGEIGVITDTLYKRLNLW